MKKVFIKFCFVTAIASIAFWGCNHDKPEDPGNERIEVKLKANVKPASQLKVANDQFQAGDEIGILMKRTGYAHYEQGALYGNLVRASIAEDGVIYTNPPLLYPLAGNVDFIAYYPYSIETYESYYALSVDVSSQTPNLPMEILYSNNIVNQPPTAEPVALNFNYSLAKLEVTVRGGANSKLTAADFADMTVDIDGIYTHAEMYLDDGTFGVFRECNYLNLRKKGFSSTSATFEALLIPGSACSSDGALNLVFQAAGVTYKYAYSSDLDAGNLYRLAFTLDFPAIPEPEATLFSFSITPRTPNEQEITISAFEPEMVFVEGGTFTMGSEYFYNTIPEHQVTLSNFKIGKYEVTEGQWKALMGKNPSANPQGADYPVENVRWFDVQDFIALLNVITGKNYRLPTEAEWEYAARGGKDYQNYYGETVVWGHGKYEKYPVGAGSVNHLGVYDAHNNVREWCSDWFGGYTEEAQINPKGPSSGEQRVIRGGCFLDDYDSAQEVNELIERRYYYPPFYTLSNVGFRLALDE